MALLRSLLLLSSLTYSILAADGITRKRSSPVYSHAFEFPLPIPAIAQPKTTYTDATTGIPIDFYELEVTAFEKHFYPELGSARLVGFNGTFPGPTFRVERGRQTVVRVVNRDEKAMTMHLHGSYSRSPWDGWARDLIGKDQLKDYYFPNAVNARTLWYHDHADKHNAENVYKGMAGMYQIFDPKEDAAVGLPSGDQYDIPLVLTAHYFTKNGQLSDVSTERTSTYGDTYMVNGQIKPFFAVEPRRYRFRILNAALSRVFNLAVMQGTVAQDIIVIGSDGGLRESPVRTQSLITGMADRWDVILDFSTFAGKNLTLTTKNMWTDTAYPGTDEVMRFVVGGSVSDSTSNKPVPEVLSTNQLFPETDFSVERKFTFDSHMDMMWGINGRHMDDPMNRILMRPPLGTTEKYTVSSKGMGMMMGSENGGQASIRPGQPRSGNSGMMSMMERWLERRNFHDRRQMMGGSGGMMGMMGGGASVNEWTHVMHLHLVDLKIVSRAKEDPSLPEGRVELSPYENGSIKDVALIGSNEKVEIIAKYTPYPGLYMLHCHNLIHEDNGMMGTFNVTKLVDLGYDALTTGLEDPMDKRFAARPWKVEDSTDLDFVRTQLLPYYASLKAYPDPRELASVEQKYWSTHKTPSAFSTGTLAASGGGMMGTSMMGNGNPRAGAQPSAEDAAIQVSGPFPPIPTHLTST